MRAWNFASKAHAEQKLPGSKVPYINHVGSVATEIIYAKMNNEVFNDFELAIQCALLHDIIEDTNVTYEGLMEEFGKEISDCVLSLTKDSSIMDRYEKTWDCIKRIKNKNNDISLVKLADRIVNLQSPPQPWSKSKRELYIYESEIILQELGTGSVVLKNRLSSKIYNYRTFYI